MSELAFLNGEIKPIDETFVPVSDRGYMFGDAVYEFIASYNGKLFCVDEHLDRLENSMAMLSYPPMDRETVKRQLFELFDQSGISRAAVYIQVSRGVAPRDHAYSKNMDVQFLMTVRNVNEIAQEIRDKGIAVITVEDDRWSKCNIKTVQILANVMAKQKAKDSGVFDAVFVSPDGIVREGTSSNFFYFKAGKLFTHPLNNHILPGVTRDVIIDIAGEMNIKTEECFFKREDIYSADEAFLTGTVTEVLGVVNIDGKVIGTGKPGDLTRRLYAGLRKKAE